MRETKKTKKRSPLLIIGVLLICIGLIGLSAWFLMESMSDIGADKTLRVPQTEDSEQKQPADKPEEEQPAEEEHPVFIDTEVVDEPAEQPVEDEQPAEEEAPVKEEEPPEEATPAEDSYLLDSSTKRLTEADVSHLSLQQLSYARNEIYARHGRKFNSKELQSYFNSKSWYKGTIEPAAFDDNVLSEIERYNVEFLRQYERKVNPAGYQLDQ